MKCCCTVMAKVSSTRMISSRAPSGSVSTGGSLIDGPGNAKVLSAVILWVGVVRGRTSLGIDCSGLVQTALAACGIEALRDSDMQEVELGEALTEVELDYLTRGDLIFWKGHVAIVRDDDTIVHANARHMAVTIEEIGEALRRIEETAGEITSVKRLFDPPIDPAFIG